MFAGITRSSFYRNYAEVEEFKDTVTRMREECEVDTRSKFELGMIPTQLAGLWMSNYGYTTKTDLNSMVPKQMAEDPLTKALKEEAERMEENADQ